MFCAGERFTLLTAHCSRPAYVRIVCARSLIRGSVRGRKPDRGERRRPAWARYKRSYSADTITYREMLPNVSPSPPPTVTLPTRGATKRPGASAHACGTLRAGLSSRAGMIAIEKGAPLAEHVLQRKGDFFRGIGKPTHTDTNPSFAVQWALQTATHWRATPSNHAARGWRCSGIDIQVLRNQLCIFLPIVLAHPLLTSRGMRSALPLPSPVRTLPQCPF